MNSKKLSITSSLPDRIPRPFLAGCHRGLLVGVGGRGFLRRGQQEFALSRRRDRDAAFRRRLDVQLERKRLR